MDSNCKLWQQAKLKRTKDLIRQVLDNEIPKRWVPTTSTDFFEFVASHVHISRSALMRSGSHYREMILSKYHDIKHASGLLEDDKLEIAKLSRALDLKELELSNSTANVDKLTKILSRMGEVQPANESVSAPSPKNYLKEYEETCRALDALLRHLEPLAISTNDEYTIVDSGSEDGSITIVVDCIHMKAYAKWKNGKK
ncbi:hypothetical protein TRP66_20035 [Pseudomonas sp. JDS28PS106]|uniref:hypothetical protein n=1 Tax=Pseudomonas sp. JDS28PS106 TaxID=2497235 RepID=UPI002FD75240